ncbi:hypothetical protein ABSH91_001458 [Salmonella enterica]
MKTIKLLLIITLFPFAALANVGASDLTTQCSATGKKTTMISDAVIDKYVSSVIYKGNVKAENVNMRINGTYYQTILHEHSDWGEYPGDGTDIAKVGFTAYTLGKKVSACVETSTGFLFGLSF